MITCEGPYFQAVCLKLRTLASDHVTTNSQFCWEFGLIFSERKFQTRSLSNKFKIKVVKCFQESEIEIHGNLIKVQSISINSAFSKSNISEESSNSWFKSVHFDLCSESDFKFNNLVIPKKRFRKQSHIFTISNEMILKKCL